MQFKSRSEKEWVSRKMFIAIESITLNKKGSLHQVVRNARMRKDISKDSFKLGVKFGVGTRLRKH